MPAIALGKTLGLAGPVNLLPIQIRPPPTAARGAENHPAGVWRPYRGGARVERQARQRVAGPVVGPHVVLCAVEEVECESTAIRCKPWMQPSRRLRTERR